jgi:hypothetical protein
MTVDVAALVAVLPKTCEAEADCRIVTTSAGFTCPQTRYGRDGAKLPLEPSASSYGFLCETCKTRWSVLVRDGEPPNISVE